MKRRRKVGYVQRKALIACTSQKHLDFLVVTIHTYMSLTSAGTPCCLMRTVPCRSIVSFLPFASSAHTSIQCAYPVRPCPVVSYRPWQCCGPIHTHLTYALIARSTLDKNTKEIKREKGGGGGCNPDQLLHSIPAPPLQFSYRATTAN